MTLVDVLLHAADEAPDRVIVHVDGDGAEHPVTFRELRDDALRVAGGLRAIAGAPGTPVILRLDRSADFQAAFWGAVLAGLVPVPLAPDQARVDAVSTALDHPPIVTRSELDSLRRNASVEPHRPAPGDLAFLQYSSGSTGDPRGVEVTHANVVANLEQAAVGGGLTASDVIVTWLPFHHDLGLIGGHLAPLAARMGQVVLSPVAFAKRPARWLEIAARHRATVLPAVNFALALVVRRVPDRVLAGLDLSAVRLCAVGAEPIAPAVWRSFLAKTAAAGLDPRALQPVYGLAEATLGVCAPPLGEIAVPLELDRAALAAGRAVLTADTAALAAGRATPAADTVALAADTVALAADTAAPAAGRAEPGGDVAEFMDVGFPVPGCTVRIVDDGRNPLPDNRIGHIEVRGPNVARGYHRDPEATAESFVDGWLRTGDLGFLRSGRLCVTGRAKDVVFVNGATFHASDLEAVAAATPGLPAGPCAVVGSPDPATGADRVVVFVPRRAPLDAVAKRIAAATGHSDVRVVPLATFPRTTSGKVRRGLLRERFEAGGYAPVSADSVVRRAWGRALRRDPATIGPHDRFLEIGGTSLTAMEVLADLEDAYGVDLDPVVLRDHGTIAALTGLLSGQRSPAARTGPGAGRDGGPVAVIGMACRFPGADTPEEFWDALLAGRDAVTASARWAGSGSFLADPAAFDATFFGVDADEARHTDPQTRILLEVAHEALERAGYAGVRRNGLRVGVFAVAGESGYLELVRRNASPRAGLIGGLRNLVAARLAHALDLDGPALVVDTACSSALVALHLARLSIAAGECDLAVVGGVNLNLTADAYHALDDAQAISPTGRCRVFSADADGIVPGEGAAALVLTGAAAARRRGDPVLALVRGSAVNNDGRSLSVLTPNPPRQAAVIARAYRDAGVDPARVSYVEAHGTGTVLGDPMEVRSLARALPPRADGGPRWLGSVKANLGHLLNAAGMPALVKVVLALGHRRLPPSPHHEPVSARLGLDTAGLAVVDHPVEWTGTGPLLAGVNGFGFGGTNVHVILEEAPPPVRSGRRPGPHLLTLSAHTPAALTAAMAALRAHALARPDLGAADICAAAGTARDHGPHRWAVVVDGDSADDVAAALPTEPPRDGGGTSAGRVAFVVPGVRPAVGVGVALARRLVAAGIRPDAVLRAGSRDGSIAGFDVVVAFACSAPVPGGRVYDVPADADGRWLLALAGRLWESGLPLDRTALDAGTVRVPVPTYPFQRQRYWIDLPIALHRPVFRPAPIVDTGTRPVVVHRVGSASIVDSVEALDAAVGAAVAAVRELTGLLVERPAVLLVTEDMCGTGAPGEVVRPTQAVAAGLALALPAELAGVGVRVVDLSTMDRAGEHAAALARERAAPPSPGTAEVVAWRSGTRLSRVPERVDVAGPSRSAGTCLITGGTGGVGRALARDLAADGSARLLILAARAAESPDGLLPELRALGARARYIRCDVTDPGSVDALAAAVADLTPTLDAVFHLAGALRPGTLTAKGDDEIGAVLAPKVRGTYLLAAALDRHDRTPRRFVCASSIVAIRPDLSGTLADYAAANRFQAAFAAGRPGAVTVHLPVLANTGMATPGLTAALTAGGVPVHEPATALRALRAALTADGPELIAGDGAGNGRAAVRRGSRTDDAASPGTGRADIRLLIERHIGRELRTDESLLRQGIDSLTAVDLVKKLEQRLGRELPTTLLFEHDTVDALAAFLDAEGAPLTPVQLAFHTAGRMYPDVAAFGYVRQTVAGPLDGARVGRALAVLAARHPMLRMRLVGPEPRQVIGPPDTVDGPPPWFTETELRTSVAALEEEASNRPIDLTREAPLRAVLAREPRDDVAHLVLVGHHAAVDGYSLHRLCQELWTIYRDGADSAPPGPFTALPSAQPSPADLAYWRTALAGYPQGLRLPYDGDPSESPAPPLVSYQVRTGADALVATAAAAGVSLFHLVLASYLRCLATWTGQERIAVNVARSGRHVRVPGIETLIGPLADVLPVVVDVRPADGVADIAVRVRQAWLESERHGSVSGVDIGRLASAAGGRAPAAGFSFARFPVTVDTDGLPEVTATAAGTGSAATRLSLLAWEVDGVLHLSWNFPLALFRRDTVARLADEHLAALTTTDARSVVRRILDRCAVAPTAVAVDDLNGGRLTYGELERASARLAGALRRRSTGAPVGLLTAPGVDTVVGVVGVLAAGAAYVPLDATHPPGRLRDQLDRCGARLVVCHAATAATAAAIGLDRLDLSTVDDDASTVDPQPGDLAYIMFTSGSTGRPKGVPVTHGALANYLDWAVDTFGYRPGDRMLQPAPICFDASVRQILAPLLAGATVVPVGRDLLLDPDALLRLVERGRITVWSSVPALWERLLVAAEKRGDRPELSALRWVHVGGEPLRADPVRRWFDLFGAGPRITNLYGPTETTINAAYHVVDRRPDDGARTVPIGRPAAGATLVIVDDELLIGGPGLSPGYLDDPERTAAAFRWHEGQRLYASGDVVRRRPDGALEFVGRRDDQVKVRGHRVEPGEAEAVLRGHPDVEHAAVLPDGNRLVAYVQVRAGSGADLRAYLDERLPEYLVPARVHTVAVLPLTAAGKVDRSRLVEAPREGAIGGPPRGRTEESVAAVWSLLLGVGPVGRGDDFFALGGDSILALDLFARLADEFADLPRPTAIYRNRTVQALAAAIDTAGTDAGTDAAGTDAGGANVGDTGGSRPGRQPAPGGSAEPFPLTASQRGFLLAEAVDPDGNHGWLARVRLRGPLDRDRFQRAVDALVERHGMLRTVFPAGARPPVQQELPPSLRLPVTYETSEVDTAVADERARRFEPWAWPLIRLRLVRVGADEHVLIVHAHHLIGDGYSAALLSRELLDRYRDPDHRPPPLRCTFRDYVAIADAGATLRPRPAEAKTSTAESLVDTRTTDRLRRLTMAHGATPHAAVLTAYLRALRRHTGRRDVVIGVATTGREYPLPDLNRLFGPCVGAITIRPASGSTFDADLRHTIAAVTAAREAEDAGTPDGDVDAFFTYLDFSALARTTEPATGLTAEWEPGTELEPPAAGTDFFLAARPTADGLLLTVRAAGESQALVDEIRTDLMRATAHRSAGSWSGTLDAALVGYLPSPAHLAALAGLPLNAVPRDHIRTALFPTGEPRLLEVTETALGRSGYVCLPRFADELSTVDDLAAEVTRAVAVAGTESVSLAGMLPSLTGYGFALQNTDTVTTGHAATAVAVAGTVLAALDAAGRKPGTIAFLGLGSIGRATLDLVLALLPEKPRRLLLCDLPATLTMRSDLCQRLRDAGYDASTGDWTDADLIVAATSATTAPLDAATLRPGTIVVDDSFPPAIDPVAALDRMRRRRDILVVGGGLLAVGAVDRITAPDLPPDVVERYAAQPRVPGTLASCQVESLARAADPGLPAVRGLVEPAVAERYRDALTRLGVGTAPLHLMHEVIDPGLIRVPRPEPRGYRRGSEEDRRGSG
ncbi:non-ribosomal peptide synthetase [Virgisporangium aurantiacum]|uniref:Amino acid adenylation domain-containing protein n=1 Tax=Virgisporangium aurantiacum TaxID=175570 RepID=A0A8J4E539_9ACTN|nr:non-ribosomal peptide synthetase [Virgisporangium aurantiacum]GIJ59532.1 hypothetical protein Vau01_070480 [Virgisporangium aurantiacum]